MKSTNQLYRGVTILFLLISTLVFSQEEPQLYVEVTTMHWNMDLEDFSAEEWKDVEVEFHEKVTMKNEHILSTTTLRHHFTTDNSEVIFVTVYSSWGAIEDAAKRNDELIEAAWPDEAERKAFFKKQSSYYANEHSDEIYRSIPGAKDLEPTDLPLIYYVRTSYLAFPEDGTNEEFLALRKEYNEAVTHNNEFYLGYYPQAHFYGADRTELVEVFLTETLAGLERGIDKQGQLFRAHWADEDKREEYNDKIGKYFTGVHSDRIYSSVPELYKSMEEPDE